MDKNGRGFFSYERRPCGEKVFVSLKCLNTFVPDCSPDR